MNEMQFGEPRHSRIWDNNGFHYWDGAQEVMRSVLRAGGVPKAGRKGVCGGWSAGWVIMSSVKVMSIIVVERRVGFT